MLAAVKDKPFGWPRKARPSLTATRHDGAVRLRSGRKNGSAGVKQKNGREGRFHAKILSSRYARATINFPGTKNRNNRGFPHQIPWWCLLSSTEGHRLLQKGGANARNKPNVFSVPVAGPDRIRALFGDPPLLRGEEASLYNNLMDQFSRLVEPKDMIEWWWARTSPITHGKSGGCGAAGPLC